MNLEIVDALRAPGPRRRWSEDVKAQTVVGSCAPYAVEVARRHEILLQLLSDTVRCVPAC